MNVTVMSNSDTIQQIASSMADIKAGNSKGISSVQDMLDMNH
jgi:hypothetical protein